MVGSAQLGKSWFGRKEKLLMVEMAKSLVWPEDIADGRWIDGWVSTKFGEVFGSSERIDRWLMEKRG